jgi:hypothetical protein
VNVEDVLRERLCGVIGEKIVATAGRKNEIVRDFCAVGTGWKGQMVSGGKIAKTMLRNVLLKPDIREYKSSLSNVLKGQGRCE